MTCAGAGGSLDRLGRGSILQGSAAGEIMHSPLSSVVQKLPAQFGHLRAWPRGTALTSARASGVRSINGGLAPARTDEVRRAYRGIACRQLPQGRQRCATAGHVNSWAQSLDTLRRASVGSGCSYLARIDPGLSPAAAPAGSAAALQTGHVRGA